MSDQEPRTGAALRDARVASGLSLYELEQRSGVHRLTIKGYEDGRQRLRPEQVDAVWSAITSDTSRGSPEPAAQADGVAAGERSTEADQARLDVTIDGDRTVPRSALSGHGLDSCASAIAEWVSGLDPTWRVRLEIMQGERGMTLRQALGTCIAYVLEHSLHMQVIAHPALESVGRHGPGPRTCPQCQQPYESRYPGQPYCGNRCAEQARTLAASGVTTG